MAVWLLFIIKGDWLDYLSHFGPLQWSPLQKILSWKTQWICMKNLSQRSSRAKTLCTQRWAAMCLFALLCSLFPKLCIWQVSTDIWLLVATGLSQYKNISVSWLFFCMFAVEVQIPSSSKPNQGAAEETGADGDSGLFHFPPFFNLLLLLKIKIM